MNRETWLNRFTESLYTQHRTKIVDFLPFLFIAFYFVHRFLSSQLSNLMTLLLKIDVYDADIFVKATNALKIK